MENTGTVTLPIEKYEAMQAELDRLRMEVKEKTIVKYTMYPGLYIIALILLMIAIVILPLIIP